jgi:glycosyltransferase involved in cell wall biosynthesis
VEYLIRAFAELVPNHNNIRLEIIGDGEQKEFLKSITKNLNVSDKVTFHGFVSQTNQFDKYITLLRSFDIFTILSIIDSETFGVAAVEASACRIPIIATSVGGLPEVVEAEKTGIIVPPKNVVATIHALKRLIENQNLRSEMGKSGRIKVEENYNWSVNVSHMLSLYKELSNMFN